MAYSTAEEFDRKVKQAIKASGRDPGNAYREMLRDRFLCRVFSDPQSRFILKGGSGMLARIPDARATRDLDFATSGHETAKTALAALNTLAAKDLGDFCSFRLTKSEESLDENGYSRLLRLRYASYIGSQEKDPVHIDLSLDCSTTLPPERMTPKNRVAIDGAAVADYLLYPLPDQLADKLCAIMELQPGGWPSSRMKDLVDVAILATHENVDLRQLTRALQAEYSRRSMKAPAAFTAPKSWGPRFDAFAKRNGAPAEYATFDAACELAARFYNPALAEQADRHAENMTWNPQLREWCAA